MLMGTVNIWPTNHAQPGYSSSHFHYPSPSLYKLKPPDLATRRIIQPLLQVLLAACREFGDLTTLQARYNRKSAGISNRLATGHGEVCPELGTLLNIRMLASDPLAFKWKHGIFAVEAFAFA